MKKVLLMAMVFLIAMTSFAFADSGPMSTVVGDIIQMAAYALALTLAGLLSLLVKKVSDKFHVSIPDTWMNSANVMIDKGIHYAEEKAKQALTANAATVDGNEKLNIAAKFVLSMTDDKKLVAMGDEKLKQLIEARLNQNKTSVIGTMMTTGPSSGEAAVTPIEKKEA